MSPPTSAAAALCSVRVFGALSSEAGEIWERCGLLLSQSCFGVLFLQGTHLSLLQCFLVCVSEEFAALDMNWSLFVGRMKRNVIMQTPAAPEVQVRNVVWSSESFCLLSEQPNHQNTRIRWTLLLSHSSRVHFRSSWCIQGATGVKTFLFFLRH